MYFRWINAYVISWTILRKLTTARICVLLQLVLNIRGYIKVWSLMIPLRRWRSNWSFKFPSYFTVFNSFKHTFYVWTFSETVWYVRQMLEESWIRSYFDDVSTPMWLCERFWMLNSTICFNLITYYQIIP
jgi:hypothetical protein